MKVKTVFRKGSGMFRLFRIMWTRGNVGDGKGYSCKLSVALCKRIAAFKRECDAWILCMCGIRVHYQKQFGGIHV